ncbi:MAG: hypothetical protein DCF22_25935 [Leptolyngbya sp.]|nr:MAG: hypothetical protein DCF22_25935 [Leptolyngbya sp.]
MIIDFEATPAIPTGPSLFSQAGPAQEISSGGVTFNGGVVLGFPTNFFVRQFSTSPNVYGTAYHPAGNAVGDPSLSSSLSITIDSALNATTVEGLLFNGLIGLDTFTINAFSQGAVVDTLLFENLASNRNRGFTGFRLNSGGSAIDFVEILPDLSNPFPGEWDFWIDTIAVGEPIENILTPTPTPTPTSEAVPEPATMLGIALAGGGFACLKRRRSV